jgi:CheY-like chemotaxis protein/HPt (histidine-containing phosphotransfer) domain-containing protein
VLVVEDSATARRAISTAAKAANLILEVAVDSATALQMIGGNDYEAVVLDLQLPDKEGFSLAGEIRDLPKGKNLPVLLMTDVRIRSDDKRPAQSGISLYVYKPVRPSQFYDAVSRAMDGRTVAEKKAPISSEFDGEMGARLPLKILLADDNLINQKVGVKMLERLGYQPAVAANGVEVLKALDQQPYDVIFLDVQMPEMDGYEASRRIHQKWSGSRRPLIIAMTGNAREGDRERCLDAGMDDYVAKPVRVTELQAVLERWGRVQMQDGDEGTVDAAEAPAMLDKTILAELRDMKSKGGDPLLWELIDLFINNSRPHLEQIKSTDAPDSQRAFAAHIFRGMSLNLGANMLGQLCEEIEDLANGGKMSDVDPLLPKLQKLFDQTHAEFNQILVSERGRGA